MLARIGYRYDPELQVNRIKYYMFTHSDIVHTLQEDEILVPYDKLPHEFETKYMECEVKDGQVVWSPILFDLRRRRWEAAMKDDSYL